VVFEVEGDGRKLTPSRPMTFSQAAVALSADLRGVKVIELIARPVGPDTDPVLATWGAARVE
jgi:hypothetical protein